MLVMFFLLYLACVNCTKIIKLLCIPSVYMFHLWQVNKNIKCRKCLQYEDKKPKVQNNNGNIRPVAHSMGACEAPCPTINIDSLSGQSVNFKLRVLETSSNFSNPNRDLFTSYFRSFVRKCYVRCKQKLLRINSEFYYYINMLITVSNLIQCTFSCK